MPNRLVVWLSVGFFNARSTSPVSWDTFFVEPGTTTSPPPAGCANVAAQSESTPVPISMKRRPRIFIATASL
jgi:hypothetical protein